MEVKNGHRSKFSNLAVGKKKPGKNQGFNRIRTSDLCDTGAMLYQLSYEVTHWELISLIFHIKSMDSAQYVVHENSAHNSCVNSLM